jgi:hypothetical protein
MQDSSSCAFLLSRSCLAPARRRRRRVGVLDFQPIGAPAGSIRPVYPLADDALQVHAAGVRAECSLILPEADWSYRCIAKLLAASIVAAATQPTIATRSLIQARL